MNKLTTIGLEIEVENILITPKINNRAKEFGFTSISDASVETSVNIWNNKVLIIPNKYELFFLENIPRGKIGGEFVTYPPLDTLNDKWTENIKSFLDLIAPLEINPLGNLRSSFHIHINTINYDLDVLKSIIKWAILTEAIMYRIGSFCEKHRGYANDYNYCRPLTHKGPQIVRNIDGYCQVLDVNKLLEAESEEEFWTFYGNSLRHLDFKYHPVRYSWINLFKLLQQERTLEFRVFNQTLNPLFVEAAVILCQCLANTMLDYKFPEDLSMISSSINNSLFFPLPERESREILRTILGMYPADPKIKDLIMWIFDNSEYPKIKDSYVYSHMLQKKDHIIFDSQNYQPPCLKEQKILIPKYKDIHNTKSIEKYESLLQFKGK